MINSTKLFFCSLFLLLTSALLPSYAATVFSANGSYTVPAGVTKIKIAVKGGGGGGGGSDGGAVGGSGAAGQLVTGTYTVTPGTVFTVVVGTGGLAGGSAGCASAGSAGGTSSYANGGAGGETGCLGFSGKGGGGGAASAVLNGSTAVLVAGGGGGGNGGATPSSTGLAGTCSSTLETSASATGTAGANGVNYATGPTDDGAGGGGGGGGVQGGTGGTGAPDLSSALSGIASTGGTGFISSTSLEAGTGPFCTGGTGGTGGAPSATGATGSVVIDEVTHIISGKVFLDVNGTAASTGTGLPNATVRLMDSSGTVYDTTYTDASGNYSLSSNLDSVLKYVVIDPPTTVLGTTQRLEQTYASAGLNNEAGGGPVCAGAYPDYTLQSTTIASWVAGAQNGSSSGPCYGGRRAANANFAGAVALNLKEFITIVTGSSNVYTGVNFGFAHHVVTSRNIVVNGQEEGTLQVVNINLNNVGSSGLSTTMRFVPSEAPTFGGAASTSTSYWQFQLAQNSSFTPVGPGLKFTRSGIVFDGRPISNADGSSYLTQAEMDSAKTVGVDAISLSAFNQPRAHLAGGGVLGNIVEINASNVTFRDFSLSGSSSSGVYVQPSPSPTGLNIFNNLLGVYPSARDFNTASATSSDRLNRGIATESLSGTVSGASGTNPSSSAANIYNNMLVRMNTEEAIVLALNASQTTNGVVVKGNRIYNSAASAAGTQAAIVVGKSGTATNNVITQNYLDNSGSNGTVNRGIATFTSTSTTNTISNNQIISAGNGSADSSAGIFLASGGNTITKNVISGTRASSVADNGNGITTTSTAANTISANSLSNNNGAGVLIGASALAVVSQNTFTNNLRNSIDLIDSNTSSVTSNSTLLNGANCVSNGSTANGGLPRPEVTSFNLVGSSLKLTALFCGTGTHTLEVYKASPGNGDFGALDGTASSTCSTPNASSATCVATGEASVYVGRITGVTGGSVFDSTVTLASGVTVADGDVLTVSSTCTAGCTSTMLGTSEMSAVKTLGSSVVSIAGKVLLDPNATAGSGSALASQTVRLFSKNGVQIASTSTNSTGDYSFNNLSPDTYYVTADASFREQTWASSGNADTGSGPICTGASPTYTARANYTTSPSEWVVGSPGSNPLNGPCYGGRRGNTGDTLSTVSGGFVLNDKEHVIKVLAVTQTAVTGVNFGFSNDVVTNANDFTTCPVTGTAGSLVVASCQGSLRQFMTNANDIAGANSMRFVPAVTPNQTTYWSNVLSAGLPTVTGGDTTLDGTAYNNTDGTSVLNTNNVVLGNTTTQVGRITGTLPGLNAPEFEIVGGAFTINSANFVMQSMGVLRGQININPSTNILFNKMLFGSFASGFTDPGNANRSTYHIFTSSNIAGMTIQNSLFGFSKLGGVFLNNFSHSDIKILDSEFRSNGLNSTVDESISMAGVSSMTGDSRVDHSLFTNNVSSGIQFYTFGGSFQVLNSSFISNGTGSNAGGINLHKNTNNLITIKDNIIQNNTGPGIYVAGLRGSFISQNHFSGNSSNAIDLSNNGVSLNTNACNNTSGAGSPNGGLARPTINTASFISGTLTVTGTMCATGSFNIELYKSTSGTGDTSATDGLSAGEGSVYLGTLSNRSGGTFSGSITTSDIAATDQITAIAIRTTAGLGTIGDTSEFAANIFLGNVSGVVFQDTNANLLASETVGDSNNPVLSGQTVRLFNSAGTQVATTTTNASGAYSFSNLATSTTYYVAVDAPIALTSVLYEQTYASAGTGNGGVAGGSGSGVLCIGSDYASHTSNPTSDSNALNPSTGACFGGRQASVADAGTTTLNTKEHVTRIVVDSLATAITDVNFGFSYNVVTNVLDSAQQGSLRQFVINANTVTGANLMRFVPSLAQNAGSGSYWSISSATTIPTTSIAITDSYTTIDGTAYSNQDGTTVVDSNAGTMGYAGSVGLGTDGVLGSGDEAVMTKINRPELEMINNSAPAAPGFLVKAANTTIQNMAILGFGNTSNAYSQIVANSTILTTASNVNNLNVNNMVLGLKANATSLDSPGVTQGSGIDITDVGTGLVLTQNIIGYMPSGNGILIWGSNSSSASISQNYILSSKFGVGVNNANSTVSVLQNKIETSGTNSVNVTSATTGGVLISENTLSDALGNSVVISGTNHTVSKNLINGTTGNAIAITSGTGNLISKNSIFTNSLLGIDLANNGVTVNDSNDSDTGANNLQNFPILGASSVSGTSLNIKGCAPASSSIEIFIADQTSTTCPAGNKNASGDGSMMCYGEGKTYLGSATAPASGSCTFVQDTDGNSITGLVNFSISVPASSVDNSGNSYITATATSSGSSSEFSPNKQVLEPILLKVNKTIVSRINSADQFTTEIRTGITANAANTTGTVVSTTSGAIGGGVSTTGSTLSFTATAYEANNSVNYTITQVMSSGAVSAANLYRTTIICSNAASSSSTVIPTSKTLFNPAVGLTLSLNAADNITCTLEDTPQPQLTLNKTVVARSASSDEFTVAVSGTGILAGVSSATTSAGASSATTELITLTQGQTYSLTDTTTDGSSSMTHYASSISCTNSNSASSTALPSNSGLIKSGSPLVVSTSISPVAGDIITCTFTNNLNLPKITIKKQTRNAVGSFSFTGNNGFVESTVTTTQDMTQSSEATTASNAGQFLASTAVATTITEVLPSAWALESASCFDNNAAVSGNPTGSVIGSLSSSNALAIDASFMKNGADLICTFINRLVNPVIAGLVFVDNGQGSGGVANDGIKNGSEAALAGVTLKLTNCSGTTIPGVATANTSADGSYSFSIPSSVSNGSSVCVEQTNLANYSSTTVAPSFQSSYERALDKVTLTWAELAITGLNFGDVLTSTLKGNINKQVAPGSSVSLPHTFTAGTAGTVSFSIVNSLSTPVIAGWSEVIYTDANCDAKIDTTAGDSVLTSSMNVTASQAVCLIVQVTSPLGIPENAQRSFQLQANFVYDNLSTVSELLSNKDTVSSSSSALVLVKQVRNVSTSGSFGIQNTAKIGEILEYQISFTNNSVEAINTLVINDATPAYTVFVSAACPSSLPSGITACATPSSASSSAPSVGATGPIKWVFTGSLPAAATGSVTYSVKVND